MRTRYVPVLLFCCATGAIRAQCGITVLGNQAWPLCQSDQRTVQYLLDWSGGTPPYTVLTDGAMTTTFMGSVNTTGPVFNAVSLPYSYSGAGSTGYSITDATGCTVSGPLQPIYPYPWIYDDALNAFTVELDNTGCSTGLFNVSLWDNPTDPGSPFLSPPADCSYTLSRNGTIVASNSFVQVFQQMPMPRLYFPSLTGGNYVLTYTLGHNSVTPLYCPSTGTIGFFVPNINDCGSNVTIKGALQGALPSGTLMTDGLRAAGLVPLTEPYSAQGYVYTGSVPGTSVSSALMAVAGNNAVVDWVVVELRNANNPSQVVSSKPALIQRDGDVMDTDGDAYVSFPVAAGNYHVAMRHRNHLGVMTGSARTLGITPDLIDFRSASTACDGTTPRVLSGGIYCLWAGNANGDGSLKYTGTSNDRDPILIAVGSTTPNNVVSNTYDRRDTNLDGVIKYTGTGNDRDIILTNVGSTTPNNTRTQQLP